MPKQPVTKLGAGVNCRKALPTISPSNPTEKGKSNGRRKTFFAPNKARQRISPTPRMHHTKKVHLRIATITEFQRATVNAFLNVKNTRRKAQHRCPLWRKLQILKLQNNGVTGKYTL